MVLRCCRLVTALGIGATSVQRTLPLWMTCRTSPVTGAEEDRRPVMESKRSQPPPVLITPGPSIFHRKDTRSGPRSMLSIAPSVMSPLMLLGRHSVLLSRIRQPTSPFAGGQGCPVGVAPWRSTRSLCVRPDQNSSWATSVWWRGSYRAKAMLPSHIDGVVSEVSAGCVIVGVPSSSLAGIMELRWERPATFL